jgi:hypothetical protein
MRVNRVDEDDVADSLAIACIVQIVPRLPNAELGANAAI